MAGNAKYFWQGFRLGFAQGCLFSAPFIIFGGCILGIITDSHALLAYATVGIGVTIWWLARVVIRQESREQ